MTPDNPPPRNVRLLATGTLGVLLCAFTLVEVNYPLLAPQSRLAFFALVGLALCFLNVPIHPSLNNDPRARAGDLVLAVLAACCCGYIVVQTDPLFDGWWVDGQTLGNRAGFETTLDTAIGLLGLLLVLEAARRALGLALPLLAGAFILYALFGSAFPDWLFPHRGYTVPRIVAQTFLHSQGIFGVALNVMFTYVFLFVIFGAFLEATGATRFIVDFAERVFGRSSGGPAKVAVLSSGLMGSLSGSAVANTATTGTFTIPMMRSAGFQPVTAAGVQAAASSGGALMPPVMGAGAYMMLEIVDPPVTYLEIIRAALIPALLYYLSLILIVHFHARRMSIATEGAPVDTAPAAAETGEAAQRSIAAGIVFGSALGSLILFLLLGYTAFRAVTLSLVAIVVVSSFNKATRLDWRFTLLSLVTAARGVVPLVAAAACVGIIIGIVTLTGIGTRLPATIIPLAEQSLFLALVLIMISSIVLGMGLPSAVCYLLMATLIGPVLGNLGVIPLAAHTVHLLLRDDVDGDAAGCAGRLRRVVDRGHAHHADRPRRVPVRVGRLHAALHVHLPAGTAHADRLGRPGRVARDAAAGRDRHARRHLLRRGHRRAVAAAARSRPAPGGLRSGGPAPGAGPLPGPGRTRRPLFRRGGRCALRRRAGREPTG